MTVVDTSMTGQVLAIAQDLFTAMVDGEPGTVDVHPDPVVDLVDPLHAWVDVHGDVRARALLATERPTADLLARALLGMGPEEPVDHEDLVDAMGEIANVVGGNIKSLLPEAGMLTLPQVDLAPPGLVGDQLHEVRLQWRGRGIVISIWTLESTEGEES